jgi:RHS repeat-associated protein
MMRVYKLKSAIERVYNNANTSYHLTDGLGSVRGMVNAMSDVLSTTTYSPYGVPDSPISGFAFTGEQRDTNGLQYHRARYYNAGLGTWASLDPFEGIYDRPMSLNGYSWVEGNVSNAIDPSGFSTEEPLPTDFVGCLSDSLPNCSNDCSGSGIFYGLCLSHCRSKSRETLVTTIRPILVQLMEGLLDIDKFYLLSNTVAELMGDDTRQYLNLMNRLLAGIDSEWNLNTALTMSQNNDNGQLRTIPIGDTGMHCDYRDGSTTQISNHTWAYITGVASSSFPNMPINIAVTSFAVDFHDQPAFGYVQDRLVGIIAVSLGTLLSTGVVKPSQFGTVFRTTLQKKFCDVIPNGDRYGSACNEFREKNQPEHFYQYLESDESWILSTGPDECK